MNEVDYTDMKVEDALIKQRDTAVEALVWAFEKREGWPHEGRGSNKHHAGIPACLYQSPLISRR